MWQAERRYSSRSLHGQVVHELGKRIVSGVLREGEVIPNEAELGAEFEVSRTALREGIKVLAAKGLLVSRTRTGTRVRPRRDWHMLDPDVLAWRLETTKPLDFINDLYDIRDAIEPVAASLAAVRASDADIAAMAEALDGMIAAGDDIAATVEPDIRFHQHILNASGNELLASLGVLIETSLAYSFMLCTPEKKINAIDLHRAVLDGIRARDSVAASAAMVHLLKVSKTWSADLLDGFAVKVSA